MSMYETLGELEGLQEWEVDESADFREVYESDELELELAQELMEVASEEELEEFLGKLIKGAIKTTQRFVRSPLGKAVTGVLRGVAKTALPAVGSAVGTFVAPGVGTMLGGQVGSMASKLLEIEELEMMGEEEAEFEAARRFVQFGRATARNAARAPRNQAPYDAARNAAIAAARRHAPGLLRQSGRQAPWRRRRRQPPRRPRPASPQPQYAWTGPPWAWPGDPYAGATYAPGSDDGSGAGDAPPDADAPANGSGTEGETGRWLRRPDGILLVGV